MRGFVGSGFATVICALSLACSASDPEAIGVSAPTDAPPAETPTPVPAAAPIVLMHGMAGFSEIGMIEYFYQVADAIRDDGYEVFALQVDPIQTIEVRAAQAATQIDAVLAETGAAQVHVIAHSQGGLDARHLISAMGYGDRIASLATIATPHHGTKVADLALGLVPGDMMAAAAAIVNLVLGPVSMDEADFEGQLVQLSADYLENVFNPSHPDDPRVQYFSIAGRTQLNPFVDVTQVDVVDPSMVASYGLVWTLEGGNDGLVAVDSAKWGAYLGEIPADHADEVGQWPLTPQPAFDHKSFYRQLAAFLRNDGPAPL